MHKPPIDEVMLHYGTKRHSGRYKWGSGEEPQSAGRRFLSQVDEHRGKGLSDNEIAAKLGMNSTQFRNNITWANKEIKEHRDSQIHALYKDGVNKSEIGRRLGISEGTVREVLAPKEKVKKAQFDMVTESLKAGVDRTGYLDVGVGVERQLGVSGTKFKAAVNKLVQDEGYHIHQVYVERLSDPTGSKKTIVKVLTKDPDPHNTTINSDKIRHLDVSSEDGLNVEKHYSPHMVDLKRIKIRYKEDGGDEKDGLIELRPGVEDLDLGQKRYAQVRIGAGENLYLKGMAAYSDAKFPPGVDIIFNTNKGKDVPKEKVLKEMKKGHELTDDPSAKFGSSILKQKGALNIVNEEGTWEKWKKTLSSQFLSKQPTSLIKERLDDTHEALKREFDEINSMTNPVVRKYLMEKYIEGLDSKAKHLKAKGIPDTRGHVLLPFPDMNPNEIYAPTFKNGDRVALVRHPHGGKFEIPELVVNNKHAAARNMIGADAPDAVGIHPSVAQKLSGADFDGDTVLVIPNNSGKVKSERALKELKNFDHLSLYKVDKDSPKNMHVIDKVTGELVNTGKTITPDYKQTLMGIVSNLITDMTIKDASPSELARAVKHSMVVIDAEKHNLDWKQSAIDNGISALRKRYQENINPDTGKKVYSASTLISRSKQKIDISQHETVKELHADKTDKSGNVLKKGMSTSEIAAKLKISEKTVNDYLNGKEFDPDKYSSGSAVESLYSGYVKNVMKIKNESIKIKDSIPSLPYSKEANKRYANEVKSLDDKLNVALLNAPRERQAQMMTNNLFYSSFDKDMDKDTVKKLKSRSLAKARVATGAKKSAIKIDAKEWEAIQAGAISTTKLLDILKNSDMEVVRKLASPREPKLNTAKATRAKTYLDKGYTLAQVSEMIGVSISTIREELNLKDNE